MDHCSRERATTSRLRQFIVVSVVKMFKFKGNKTDETQQNDTPAPQPQPQDTSIQVEVPNVVESRKKKNKGMMEFRYVMNSVNQLEQRLPSSSNDSSYILFPCRVSNVCSRQLCNIHPSWVSGHLFLLNFSVACVSSKNQYHLSHSR